MADFTDYQLFMYGKHYGEEVLTVAELDPQYIEYMIREGHTFSDEVMYAISEEGMRSKR